MENAKTSALPSEVMLRDVTEADLPIFFEQQLDPEATRMAAFPARERDAFMAHWAKILQDQSLIKQTIVFAGQVAGNMGSFVEQGEQEVGYWLGRDYWGKGIATIALREFLPQVKVRPLYAYVAKHNIGSRRVLEKCGFRFLADAEDTTDSEGKSVPWIKLILEASS